MTDGPVYRNKDEEHVRIFNQLMSGVLPDRMFIWVTGEGEAFTPDEIPDEQLPVLMKQLWNVAMGDTGLFPMDVPALPHLHKYTAEYLTQALRCVGWHIIANQEKLPLTLRERYEIKFMALQAKALMKGPEFDPAERAQLIQLAQTVSHLQKTGEFPDGTDKRH